MQDAALDGEVGVVFGVTLKRWHWSRDFNDVEEQGEQQVLEHGMFKEQGGCCGWNGASKWERGGGADHSKDHGEPEEGQEWKLKTVWEVEGSTAIGGELLWTHRAKTSVRFWGGAGGSSQGPAPHPVTVGYLPVLQTPTLSLFTSSSGSNMV